MFNSYIKKYEKMTMLKMKNISNFILRDFLKFSGAVFYYVIGKNTTVMPLKSWFCGKKND